MIKGVTKTGFRYQLYEDKLDDYELLEMLCEIDNGNMSLLTKMAKQLLGEKQLKKLKEHVRDKHGTVSANRMMDEVAQIFNGVKNGKNS